MKCILTLTMLFSISRAHGMMLKDSLQNRKFYIETGIGTYYINHRNYRLIDPNHTFAPKMMYVLDLGFGFQDVVSLSLNAGYNREKRRVEYYGPKDIITQYYSLFCEYRILVNSNKAKHNILLYCVLGKEFTENTVNSSTSNMPYPKLIVPNEHAWQFSFGFGWRQQLFKCSNLYLKSAVSPGELVYLLNSGKNKVKNTSPYRIGVQYDFVF